MDVPLHGHTYIQNQLKHYRFKSDLKNQTIEPFNNDDPFLLNRCESGGTFFQMKDRLFNWSYIHLNEYESLWQFLTHLLKVTEVLAQLQASIINETKMRGGTIEGNFRIFFFLYAHLIDDIEVNVTLHIGMCTLNRPLFL